MSAAVGAAHKVVVTGLGLVTPLGVGVPAFWDGITSGVSAVSAIDRFDASTFPTRIAATVKDEHYDARKIVRNRKSLKIMKRAAKFAVGAAHLAVEDAGLDWAVDWDPYVFAALWGFYSEADGAWATGENGYAFAFETDDAMALSYDENDELISVDISDVETLPAWALINNGSWGGWYTTILQ